MLQTETVHSGITGFLRIPKEKVTDETVLTELVRESFVLVEMVMFLQDELGVRVVQDDLKDVRTVGDLVRALQSKSA